MTYLSAAGTDRQDKKDRQDNIMVDEEKLMQVKIDYQEGLKRFSGQRNLYEKYLFGFQDDPMFHELEQAMEAQDYEKAFRRAHAFKGLVGNLSMVGLYRMVVPFVEALREGFDIPHAVAMFPEVKSEYEKVLSLIKSQRD